MPSFLKGRQKYDFVSSADFESYETESVMGFILM